MRKLIVGWVALTCSAAFGQAQSFEVASVRPAAAQSFNPNTMRMSADPGQLTYSGLTLKSMLSTAYGVMSYQISGPGWLDTERYDIAAKIPPGTTKEQTNAMLRNLVAERFNLTLHHETRDIAVYALSIGKNGSKLKEADLDVLPPPEPGAPPTVVGKPDKDGFPQLPPGHPLMVGKVTDGRMRLSARMKSAEDLAGFLVSLMHRPVVDRTGLTGMYDFTLEYSTEATRSVGPPVDDLSGGGLSFVGAVQEQLGLKLESAKAPFDVLVLDHVDRVPTEN